MNKETLKCEHNYQYKGLEWKESKHERAGTGARDVDYYDTYFCTKCLAKEHQYKGALTNTYEPKIIGSVPK